MLSLAPLEISKKFTFGVTIKKNLNFMVNVLASCFAYVYHEFRSILCSLYIILNG